MKLKLVLKGPERLMGAQLEKTLENGSLVVGRSPAAGWVLPDPERLVSKMHCRIDKDFNGFLLTDTSTNGVRVNDEAIGFGLPRLLADGDVLKLGDATVVVRVEADPPPPPVAAAVVAPIGSDGPFGPAEAGVADIAVQPADSPSAAEQTIEDDWWKPDAAAQEPTPLNSVDILPQEAQEEIPRTTTQKDSLPLPDGDVAFLVDSLAGIDLMALARAVDAAGSALPEEDRRRFHERLRDLLSGSGGQQT